VKSFVNFVEKSSSIEIQMEDELFDSELISASALSNFNPNLKIMEKKISQITMEKKQPQIVKNISKERKIENILEYSLNYESIYSYDDLNLAFKNHLESEYNLGNFLNWN
jgi:hypothetical protein